MAEANGKKRSRSQEPRHIMRPLVDEIARTFRAPRPYLLTTAAVQQDEKMHRTAIDSCLLHNLFDRVEALERESRRNKPALTYVMGRRSA